MSRTELERQGWSFRSIEFDDGCGFKCRIWYVTEPDGYTWKTYTSGRGTEEHDWAEVALELGYGIDERSIAGVAKNVR